MGFVGPSIEEMATAVERGLQRAIRKTTTVEYTIKTRKYDMGIYDHMIIPKILEASVILFEEYDKVKFETIDIIKNFNDTIYEVFEDTYINKSNPFTDQVTSELDKSKCVGKFYQHEGWSKKDVEELIEASKYFGGFPNGIYVEIILDEYRKIKNG